MALLPSSFDSTTEKRTPPTIPIKQKLHFWFCCCVAFLDFAVAAVGKVFLPRDKFPIVRNDEELPGTVLARLAVLASWPAGVW